MQFLLNLEKMKRKNQKFSEFEIKVLKEIMKIPRGQAKTYREIAEAVGNRKASRAVGRVCAKNPMPIIIPCHRVIGRGCIGGYSLGLDMKKKLLEFEKCSIDLKV